MEDFGKVAQGRRGEGGARPPVVMSLPGSEAARRPEREAACCFGIRQTHHHWRPGPSLSPTPLC